MKLKHLNALLWSAALALAVLLLTAAGALGAGPGQPVVELRQEAASGVTWPDVFPGQSISGTDSSTKQEYKFQRQREGTDFSYHVANLLPSTSYRVELSFVEHEHPAAGRRVFNVYLGDQKALDRLDIYAMVGRDRAYQRTFSVLTDARGVLRARFTSAEAGGKDQATVSTVRVYIGSANAVEISAAESRHEMSVPTRFSSGPGQDAYETVLARLGARFSLNLVPQKLGARFNPLGDGTGDLSDLVMGVHDRVSGEIRCLPFTDRYPVWENMEFTQTMTSQEYRCSSPELPFTMTVKFRSPFYPGDERVSGAPFIYVDVTLEKNGSEAAEPEFIFARPHRSDFGSQAVSPLDTADSKGLKSTALYSYYHESYSRYRAKNAAEALSVPAGEAGDVEFRGGDPGEFADFTQDTLWGYGSPAGYPRTYTDYRKPLFSFYPRGYTGAVWAPALGPGESRTKPFILAGYVSQDVLTVRNTAYSDGTFRFKYCKFFSSLEQVVDYAVTDRDSVDGIEARTDFFDRTFSSEEYLSLPAAHGGPVKELMAFSFQSFLMNTWWARSRTNPSREWFSVLEGTCRFHSTIDAEYNQAWFYFHFWPELMEMLMDQWVLYPQEDSFGTYLSHDMGYADAATGQAYPHSMAVEENANFILMLHKYWKATGDGDYVKGKMATVRDLVDFIINCDANNNGLPDRHTANTVDDGSLAIQNGKDQSYLGIKCLAAHQAARQMALADPTPQNIAFAEKCRGQVEAINQALEYDMWLSDHFAVAFDPDLLPEDREAYSIYPSNGMLYLWSGTRAAGLTSTNTSRMRADLETAAAATLRTYGCTHSSYDAYRQWVSQNLWRDQAACMLGVQLNKEHPLALSGRYWNLQQYFARSLWGTFWDVVVYPGGSGGGDSERATSSRPGRSGAAARAGVGPGTFGQSLGYYPRGVVSLGLIDAVAGLTLDAPSGALYYRQSAYPLRVPVFSCADWDEPDEAKRVPTLFFAGGSGAPETTNPQLLPGGAARPRNVADLTGVTAGPHAISPNGDGINDSATIEYGLPKASAVGTSIWESSTLVREYGSAARAAGKRSFTWDGRDRDGAVVEDGIYTARVDAVPDNTAHELRPAGAPVYVNNTIPDLSRDWYLAEGFTGSSGAAGKFQTYVLIQNPNVQEAGVEVTFMLPGGDTVTRSYQVPGTSRFTVTVDDILPDAEMSTRVRSDRPVAVERAMYFNGFKAGHASTGVTSPSETWYLAEGYTADGFDEFVLIQNPGGDAAEVTATFMTPGAGTETRRYTVGPNSRFTVHVNNIVPAQSVSTMIESSRPVVVERAQYLNGMRSGTCSIGAVSTSRTWFLAEGYTDQGFETWVLVQNPQKVSNLVTVIFMEREGPNTIKQYLLPPQSRFTILADAYLEASEVSVKVRAQHPVLVERAMYWNDRSDGHASIATPTPDSEWYLAEGYTDRGFETWVVMQNPGDEQRNVTMTMMEPGGRTTVRSYVVNPRSRFTVGLNEVIPNSEVSTRLTADGPVIVERAIYFNARSGGTCSPGIRGY